MLPAETVVSVQTELPASTGTSQTSRPDPNLQTPPAREHNVQVGETLTGIAFAYGVSVQAMIDANQLTNPDLLRVGQVLAIPLPAGELVNPMMIIPDTRIVRGPGAKGFDPRSFVMAQQGQLKLVTDIIDDRVYDSASIVERVSLEFSVDARILLTFLELRGGWLSEMTVSEPVLTYPITHGVTSDGVERKGLYRQLAWLANQLNRGFYGWKYGGLTAVDLVDGTTLRFAPDLNAGTVSLLYALGLLLDKSAWTNQVAEGIFRQVYEGYFGDIDLGQAIWIPPPQTQPILDLPFASGEVWYFTGGPHGGWGSGSAWSAIDFAPPIDQTDEPNLCFISTSMVRAVADGLVVRSGDGVVILDLDRDGDEGTGWSILYLHIAEQDRVISGLEVTSGEPIGRASCEGGFSNATHVHIARRYNGEWIPANCQGCLQNSEFPPFTLGGWVVYDLIGQEYQGFLQRGIEVRRAEQGRNVTDNRVSW